MDQLPTPRRPVDRWTDRRVDGPALDVLYVIGSTLLDAGLDVATVLAVTVAVSDRLGDAGYLTRQV